MKTTYYYNHQIGLDEILADTSNVDELVIADFEFWEKGIMLNGERVESAAYHKFWTDVEQLYDMGVTISVLFQKFSTLIEDPDKYTYLLENFISSRPYISGINLMFDESCVGLEDAIAIVLIVRELFGPHFQLSVDISATEMVEDIIGLGGFRMQDLHDRIGIAIDKYNVQAFGDMSFNKFSADVYRAIVAKYPKEKINMGMVYTNVKHDTFHITKQEIDAMVEIYPDIGIFIWEYAYAYDTSNPMEWARRVKESHAEPASVCAIC